MSSIFTIPAFISSILFSLSQATLIHICQKSQIYGTNFTSPFSIISCLAYEVIWLEFYLKNEDNNICWCYLSGACLSYIWIVIYFIYYSKKNEKSRLWFIFLYIFTITDIVVEICYIENDLLENNKNTTIRMIASFFNILMYISPGLNTHKLFTDFDIGYISLPISVIGFFNSFIWLLYGFTNTDDKNNKYYIYPNFFGIVICLIQIMIFFLMRNEKKQSKIKVKLVSDKSSNKSKKKRKSENKQKKIEKTEEEEILDII